MKCGFWCLVYLKIFYENNKSKGKSYVFKAFEESNPYSSQGTQKDQYLKNASRLSELIKQAKEKAEKAKKTQLLDENNQNKVDK